MIRVAVTCCVIMAMALGASRSAAGEEADVEVIGERVTLPVPPALSSAMKQSRDERIQALERRFSAIVPGISLKIRIVRPSKYFIGCDEKASKQVAFTDDQGTDLWAGKGRLIWHNWIDPQGLGRYLEVRSEIPPKKSATKLLLEASVVMEYGGDEKAVELKDIPLKAGTEFTAGPATIEITRVCETAGRDALIVDFESTREFSRIKTIVFVGPDGKSVDSEMIRPELQDMGEEGKVIQRYRLPTRARQATLRITYFEKVEKVGVPIKITRRVSRPRL